MRPTIITISLLLLSLPIAVVIGQDDSPTPAEQYKSLLREYRPASYGQREAKTDLQRKQAVEQMGAFPIRFVELAEKNSKDPIVLEVLRQAMQIANSTDSASYTAWETNQSHFPVGSQAETIRRIIALLMRDHMKSDKLGPIIDRARYGYRLDYDTFLTAVMNDNPNREMQALACLALAQYLHDRLRAVQLVEESQALESRYEAIFGKGYLPKLRRLKEAGLEDRIEQLFEQASKYEDVQPRFGNTVALQAQSALYDIRNLSVGKIAPDIEGKDQDGKSFKLSDYRGKSVLLYFWVEF